MFRYEPLLDKFSDLGFAPIEDSYQFGFRSTPKGKQRVMAFACGQFRL